MAYTVGDIAQIKLAGSYLGQDVYNVFHYYCEGASTDPKESQHIIDAFDDSVLFDLMPLLQSAYSVVSVECYNIRLPSDFDVRAGILLTNNVGSATGAPAPSWLTYTFKYDRVAVGQRHGYKRFAGVTEDYINGNEITGSGITKSGVLANTLDAGLVTATGGAFVPFIAKRPIVLGTNPAGYRSGGVIFNSIGSQNSRKP